MKLPVFELKINEALDDNSEVEYIALVEEPAIMKDFLAFKDEFVNPAKGEEKDAFLQRCIKYIIDEGKESEQAVAICNSIWDEHFSFYNTQKERAKFQIVSEDKHIISGPIMIADELIYRKPNAKIITEHYVKFSAETIKDIAIKFAKKKYQENVNLMHDPNQKVDGVVMFESFLVDKSRGIKPMAGFEDVPDGSWFGSFYVENAEVWASIKEGTYKGFSVEGLFDYGDALKYEDEMLQRIKNILFS
jgi:hypothetical protein